MKTNMINSKSNLQRENAIQGNSPMDTSQILMGLMEFSNIANQKDLEVPISQEMTGVISPNLLRILLFSLQFRDPATVNHTRRVAMLATGIAEYIGWEYEEQKKLEIAGLLHDIGKIGVPDSVLFKPGTLGPEEISLLALHHNVGVDLLQACQVDESVLKYIAQSHRDHNSPLSDISQGAKIIAIADAYDSLRSDHVYRDGLSHEDAIRVIKDSAGIQFDTNFIDALCKWIDTEGIQFDNTSFRMSENPQAPVLNGEDSVQINLLNHICSYLYILENLYDGFFIVDSDLRFSIWNSGMEYLYEKSSSDILGHSWTSSQIEYLDKNENKLPEEDYPLNQAIQSKNPISAIVKSRLPNGKINEIEIQAIPILDSHGELHGVAEIHRNLSETRENCSKVRDLKIAASRDALTGVINRGELETQLAKLLTQQFENESTETFSVIFLDVDHFKSVNDTYGHSVGDDVLIELTQLLDKETYSGELIGRYGGEEFVLLCPETDIDSAYNKTERLRLAIANCQEGAIEKCCITASFGVTESVSGDTVESILKRADEGLYNSKENGRNCTTINCSKLGINSDNNSDTTNSKNDPFRFVQVFKAFTISDLLIYKLSGYINSEGIDIIKVSKEEIQLKIGKNKLFSRWGKTEDLQSVIVSIRPLTDHDRRTRKTSSLTPIEVSIVPNGKVTDPELFHRRAYKIFQNITSYFIASIDNKE